MLLTAYDLHCCLCSALQVVIANWFDSGDLITNTSIQCLLRDLVKFWRRGLVHGDLRPPGWGGNIIFDASGAPRVFDFDWAGKYQGPRASNELAEVREAIFPENVNSNIFEKYLPDVPKGGQKISLAHDIDCIVGWLREHFIISGRKEEAAELLAALKDHMQTAIGAADPNPALFRVGKTLGNEQFKSTLASPLPEGKPHFGDPRIEAFETDTRSVSERHHKKQKRS